ncbi:MAG: hypothetical protein K2X98_00800 [Alphaproteobacteria bacterium]|nr:hypothetical protein [Alphaproteobacteria bacterium]
MKQIVLDTETTKFSFAAAHRITDSFLSFIGMLTLSFIMRLLIWAF